MPSFTFVSTANAVVLRGGVPVFVDIRSDTLNLDEEQVEAAVTPRTKAILAVHYAGVGCEMSALADVAGRDGLVVLEDAAQAILCSYEERPLGSFGAASALSFHETKNVIAGEGGALVVNDPAWVERAEILQEKGTNRSRFFRGEIDKYTWVDIGSSFLMSEISAAFLWAQIERARAITRRRLEIWDAYHQAFEKLEREGAVRRPIVPDNCAHNAHMYYLLLPTRELRDLVIEVLRERGAQAVFHYVPLHSAPAGRRFGRAAGDLAATDAASEQLVRLPLWPDMDDGQVARVIDGVVDAVMRESAATHT
jgi:dTDP-4-amino-4,6-dideoxygalactose transaminase